MRYVPPVEPSFVPSAQAPPYPPSDLSTPGLVTTAVELPSPSRHHGAGRAKVACNKTVVIEEESNELNCPSPARRLSDSLVGLGVSGRSTRPGLARCQDKEERNSVQENRKQNDRQGSEPESPIALHQFHQLTTSPVSREALQLSNLDHALHYCM